MRTKAQLREDIRALGKCRPMGSEAMTDLILVSPQYKNAKTILAFYGVPPEPDTAGFIEKALQDGKQICLPKTFGNGIMDAREIKSLSDLVMGRYGIPEPPDDLPVVLRADIDLILVPGLSFDRCGYRLGHGAGYYDRYLGYFNGSTIGLCFESRLSDQIPIDKYDQPVRYIITEKRAFGCSR